MPDEEYVKIFIEDCQLCEERTMKEWNKWEFSDRVKSAVCAAFLRNICERQDNPLLAYDQVIECLRLRAESLQKGEK
jgi:hypothetical protein